MRSSIFLLDPPRNWAIVPESFPTIPPDRHRPPGGSSPRGGEIRIISVVHRDGRLSVRIPNVLVFALLDRTDFSVRHLKDREKPICGYRGPVGCVCIWRCSMDEVLGNECLSLQYCPSMGDNMMSMKYGVQKKMVGERYLLVNRTHPLRVVSRRRWGQFEPGI